MARIRILPEILSNKIAAGEVIERPASVVKELLENALDAESTRILIELKQAGKSLLQVTDNGLGMHRDDALLSVERYATSKLFKDEDLFEIKTLGFRGEALPSIASVSRFCVESRDKLSEVGIRIQIEGGKIQNVTDIGAPIGTQVSVKDLFFNTPARRKFLKTANTEMGHITDTVAKIALAWPGVMFRLIHNGKIVKNWPAANPEERVADVVGGSVRGGLLPLDAEYSGMRVSGWAARADMARNTPRGIYIYVNHRYIRNRMIQHALMEGYANRLMKGQFPVAVLFLAVPFDQVDVNVHPSKHEVRFADSRAVHQLIRTATANAVAASGALKWTTPPITPKLGAEASRSLERSIGNRFKPTAAGTAEPEPPPEIREKAPVFHDDGPAQVPVSEQQPSLWPQKRFSDLRVIGQFQDTYILCESASRDLILIDQHAAHERIRYEQLSADKSQGTRAVQQLLIPETLELGYEETRILHALMEELARFGLEIAPFGGNTVVIKTVPAMLSGKQIAPLILEIAEKTADIGIDTGIEKALDQVRKLMACHSALKANRKLTDKEVKALLEQLDACDDPSHCPHGRPTWIQWELPGIEKSFRRIT